MEWFSLGGDAAGTLGVVIDAGSLEEPFAREELGVAGPTGDDVAAFDAPPHLPAEFALRALAVPLTRGQGLVSARRPEHLSLACYV